MIKQLLIVLLIVFASSKLQQVVSLFRHGARYHLNSDYDGNATKPLWGQLTAVGMRQHQNFGRMLRKQYIEDLNFLSSDYVQSQIQVYCTIVNRTVQSVRSQLYGLYPLGKGPKIQNVRPEYHIPPYSMKTDISQNNFALPSGHLPFIVRFSDKIFPNCKNYDSQGQKNVDSQKVVVAQMNLTYQPFLKKLSTIFNIPLADLSFSRITRIYDTLTVDKFLGRPIPDTITNDDYLNLRHLHQWYMHLKQSNNLAKAFNTPKLDKVLQVFDARVINQKKPLKWTFISAHDTDIVPMSNGMNFTSFQCIQQKYRKGKTDALNCESGVQFASSIIFELHSQNQRDFYVKVKKQGQYMYLCQTKNITCSYTQWKRRVKNAFVNVDQVCGNNKLQLNNQNEQNNQERYS